MEPGQDRVRRAQEGDDVAFAQLAREIRPVALRWAMVHTASADDAEDVAQAALMRVHRSLAEFRDGARFTTWLYAIVRRAAADWRRGERRRAVREQRWAAEQDSALEPGAGRTDVERELAAALALLRTLPARQRAAFDLTELQGKSYDEAAELLGLSASTVRVHVLRARRTVRAALLAANAEAERP